jgi:NADPH-dependent 2,4-dienoyl-CoA reductase/sulfur reductase-like enzyme
MDPASGGTYEPRVRPRPVDGGGFIKLADSEPLWAAETRCARRQPRADHTAAKGRRPAARAIQRHPLTQHAGRVRDVIIVGSGPAGYTAVIYTARAGLDTLVVEGHLPGGALMTAGQMDNYPGLAEAVCGPSLARAMRAQAHRFGAEFHAGDVDGFDLEGASSPRRSTTTCAMPAP